MIFPHIPIVVNRQEVVRYLGYKKYKSESTDEINRLIDKCIRDAAYVLEAKGVIRQFAITARNAERWEIECNAGEYYIQGERIFKHLQLCDSLTLMMVTVGDQLDKEVERLFSEQLPTKALIIDAIGSDAVERAADYINEYIKNDARRKGYATRFRFSPGYGGWSIEHQRDLIKAVDGASIDVTLTDSCQLQPRKSVSAVIGWYIQCDGKLQPPRESREQVTKCRQCDVQDCQFRN